MEDKATVVGACTPNGLTITREKAKKANPSGSHTA